MMNNLKKILIGILFSFGLVFFSYPVFASNPTVDAIYNSLESKYSQLTPEQQQNKWKEIKKVLELLSRKYPKLKDLVTLLIVRIDVKIVSFSGTNLAYDVSELDQIRQEMIVLVNKEREKVGLDVLVLNSLLNQSAQLHARYMALTDDFEHITKDGVSPMTRMQNAGYTGTTMGENIAWNQRSVQEVVDAWMNSPGHKENILRKSFKEVGIGFKDYYWVQNFGGY